MKAVKVVFFDIGDTLAVVNPSSTQRLELVPLPGASDALRSLTAVGLRLGMILQHRQ